jgi:pSer/pThr/pTyr-binding forkhead associated (FHA) protein
MSKSVTIGSRPDCDLVLNVASVSGHHCRLTRDENGFVLEDLNSTNGTFVNGERIRGEVRLTLSAADTIHLRSYALPVGQMLGLLAPEPTPTISFRGAEMVIGRVSGCDHVIDLPMISSRHARLFREGGRILIEDLRSSNGTFVNGTRVEGPVVLNQGDEVGLGSHCVTLAADSWTQADEVQPARPGQLVSETPGGAAPSLSEIPVPAATHIGATGLAEILNRPWPLAALLAQAPLIALLIAGLGRTDSPAPILIWLGLAAIWFGLADAVLGNLLDPARLRDVVSPEGAPVLALRLLILAALCVLQCLLAWVVVANMAGLKSPGLPVLVLLVLAAAVGLALGLMIVVLSPRPTLTWAILPVLVLLMWLFGGQWRPLHRMPAAAGVVSGFLPSRWAFEGLALLEAGQRQVAGIADGSDPEIDNDFAEDYFPQADRMGVRADVMALGAMLFGLTGAVAFISASAKPAR